MAKQIKMSAGEQKFWWESIQNRKTLMKPKHELWRKLYKRYGLEGIDIVGMSDEDIVKISRLYPMVRKIKNGIAFNYPEILVEVEEEGELGPGMEEVLEVAANDGMKRMDMKREIQQGVVDALFCFRPWWKIELANDSANGILSTRDIENFTKFSRVDPFKVFVAPGTLPHNYKTSPNIIEEGETPLQWMIDNPRFEDKKALLKGLSADGPDKTWEDTFGGEDIGQDTDKNDVEDAKNLMKMTTWYEVHDRMSGQRKFFVSGIREPIENIDHPFLEADSKTIKHPITGTEEAIEYTRPANARFIIEGGLPYFTEAYDSSDQFYGTPIAAYEEQIEKLTMESQSRRADNLQRMKRVLLADDRSKEENPNFGTDFKKADDGTIVFVTVPDGKSIRETVVPADFGSPQPDQIQLERDVVAEESNLIQVEARGGRTATEAAINAGPAEVNRAAMQVVPINGYSWGIGAMLDIQADPRYSNEKWLNSLAVPGAVSPDIAVQREWLRVKKRVDIHAASLTPFAAEMERDSTLAFTDRYANDPFFDGKKLRRLAAKAFNFPDVEGLFRTDNNIDAFRSAQFELVNYLLAGQPIPSPVRGEDHQTHFEVQNANAVQNMPQFQQVPPQMQQALLQTLQKHLEETQAMVDEEASGTSGPSAVSKPDSNELQTLTGKVRSNAQGVSNLIQTQSKDQGVI